MLINFLLFFHLFICLVSFCIKSNSTIVLSLNHLQPINFFGQLSNRILRAWSMYPACTIIKSKSCIVRQSDIFRFKSSTNIIICLKNCDMHTFLSKLISGSHTGNTRTNHNYVRRWTRTSHKISKLQYFYYNINKWIFCYIDN